MSAKLDAVLDLIDGGLQSSRERGYGTDIPGLCARCQRYEPEPDGALCAGCRAFLLGDIGKDPRLKVDPAIVEASRRALERFAVGIELDPAALDAVAAFGQAFSAVAARVIEAMAQVWSSLCAQFAPLLDLFTPERRPLRSRLTARARARARKRRRA